jgi:hypothetical protein
MAGGKKSEELAAIACERVANGNAETCVHAIEEHDIWRAT